MAWKVDDLKQRKQERGDGVRGECVSVCVFVCERGTGGEGERRENTVERKSSFPADFNLCRLSSGLTAAVSQDE